MLTSDALAYCDNSPVKLGGLVGVSSQAVSQWGEYVPELSAAKLEKITGGKLAYDYGLYRSLEDAKKKAA